MGFGFQTSGGDGGEFLPLLTYSAKSGAFGTRDSEERDGVWEKTERELEKEEVVFVADFATVQQGWLLVKKGVAPIKAFAPLGQPLPPRPAGFGERDDKGREILPKNAFSMRVMLRDGVLREFSGNSLALVGAVGEVLDAYQAAPEAATGQLPVVKMTGRVKADKNGNYRPLFAIEKWVPRPEAFGAAAPSPAAPATQPAPRPAAPAAPPANHVPPPAPVAASAASAAAPF